MTTRINNGVGQRGTMRHLYDVLGQHSNSTVLESCFGSKLKVVEGLVIADDHDWGMLGIRNYNVYKFNTVMQWTGNTKNSMELCQTCFTRECVLPTCDPEFNQLMKEQKDEGIFINGSLADIYRARSQLELPELLKLAENPVRTSSWFTEWKNTQLSSQLHQILPTANHTFQELQSQYTKQQIVEAAKNVVNTNFYNLKNQAKTITKRLNHTKYGIYNIFTADTILPRYPTDEEKNELKEYDLWEIDGKPEEKAKICSAYVDEYANMLVLVQVFRDLVKQAISLANLLGQAMENQILGNVIRHCKDFSDAQLMTAIKQFKEQQAVNSVFPEIRLALNTNFSIEETRTDARTNLSWIFL